MNAMARMGIVMAGILVGLGVAVFAKAVDTVGFDRLVLGHVVGPGLVLAGLIRIRLQRMLQGGTRRGGSDGGVDGTDGDGGDRG